MKRLVSLSVVVVFLMAVFAPSVFAGWFWCEDDPAIDIVTPAGNTVVVHVTNYGGGNNLTADQMAKVQAAVASAEIKYEVESIKGKPDDDERGRDHDKGARGTRVEMTVLIANVPGVKLFKTQAVVSSLESGAGVVYDTASGHSGESMKLKFDLNVP